VLAAMVLVYSVLIDVLAAVLLSLLAFELCFK